LEGNKGKTALNAEKKQIKTGKKAKRYLRSGSSCVIGVDQMEKKGGEVLNELQGKSGLSAVYH